MKLEEIALNPREALLLVVDIQRDFLEPERGFVFYDAENGVANMQAMVIEHLIPLILQSLKEKAHVAYAKAEYPAGKFPPPYDKLCSKSPGKDFYFIDCVKGFGKVKVFRKNEHDCFANPDLKEYIEQNKIRDVILTGVTLTNCIDAAVQSAVLIPDLNVVVPENCVSYRLKRESDARAILEAYSSADNKRVAVVSSGQIKYQ